MVYVLSDIHGNLPRFETILEQISFGSDDELYILGDVIDRGKDGIRILWRIMEMPNVHLILGNHEYMMLNSIAPDELFPEGRWTYWDPQSCLHMWYKNGGKVTHDYLKHLRKAVRMEIFEYLVKLPLYYDITVNDTRYKLVHTAPSEDYPLYRKRYYDEQEFVLWHRWELPIPEREEFIMVFGHTPTNNFQYGNPLTIYRSREGRNIGIDCGSSFPKVESWMKYPAFGRLACLRLDDGAVFYSDDGGYKDFYER